jgi:long-subunit acyl-CoA synthetase (AMP-forming)
VQFQSLGKLALDGWEKTSSSRHRATGSNVATLVFTSGTTSTPKAAALMHSNILYQVKAFPFFLEVRSCLSAPRWHALCCLCTPASLQLWAASDADNCRVACLSRATCFQVKPGQTSLSLLPPWHIYERTVMYYLLSQGAKLVYSTIKRLKEDLATVKPDYLVCVPVLLDTLHVRIMTRLSKMHGLLKGLVLGLVSVAQAHVRVRRPSCCCLNTTCVGRGYRARSERAALMSWSVCA